jgi:hypothetical protein
LFLLSMHSRSALSVNGLGNPPVTRLAKLLVVLLRFAAQQHEFHTACKPYPAILICLGIFSFRLPHSFVWTRGTAQKSSLSSGHDIQNDLRSKHERAWQNKYLTRREVLYFIQFTIPTKHVQMQSVDGKISNAFTPIQPIDNT